VGELRIVVPEGVPLDVHATAGVGEVEVLDRSSSGVGAKVEELFEDDSDGPTLRIEASVGVGQIRVVRP
jgi:predicted membrane protein